MRLVSWLGLATLVGCANYETVDDACSNGVRGERHGSAEAVELIGRISCYRRFVGLDRADIDKRVTEAVVSHATYLSVNQVMSTGAPWQSESASVGGYTGDSATARLVASGFLIEGVSDAFVWELLLTGFEDRTRTELVDELMIDPIARDALLAPAWEGSGYEPFTDPVAGAFAYANIVLAYPSGSHTTRPIVYPQDGQTDLPTSWPGASVAGFGGATGFPITFTMGSSQIVAASTNPLEVRVLGSTITGPSGPVPHTVLLPGPYASGVNWSTAVLVPTDPLEPDSVYTVEAELAWIDVASHTEELTFSTAAQ